ncbi:hypothetical protein OE88DRAFT_1627143 [Heliocybe sulcata]|uniref:Oxidase ustYa n=1 Tax=Heliocybe sulcata TaxID=5364 RepID=A0A5C3N9J0_9AGAM|nr:hypothetical protein OE88DRAFT_1627143 [Heliocybe sulcata]
MLIRRSKAYLAHDYPESLPMDELEDVFLSVEDTVHYQITSSDSPTEWGSLFPPGEGFVHMGAQDRPFCISMFHQLHCLNNLKKAVVADQLSPGQSRHLDHCINYLRESVLCHPSLRLEPRSVHLLERYGIKGVDGLGLVHECRDWQAVYEAAAENFSSWKMRTSSGADI